MRNPATFIFIIFALNVSHAAEPGETLHMSNTLLSSFKCEESDYATRAKEEAEKIESILKEADNTPGCKASKETLAARQAARPAEIEKLVTEFQNHTGRTLGQAKKALNRFEVLSKSTKLDSSAAQQFADKALAEATRINELQLQLEAEALKSAADKPIKLATAFNNINSEINNFIDQNDSRYQCLGNEGRQSLRASAINMGAQLSGLLVSSSLAAPIAMGAQILNSLFDTADKLKEASSGRQTFQAVYNSVGITCALKSLNKNMCVSHKRDKQLREIMSTKPPEDTQAKICTTCDKETEQFEKEILELLENLKASRKQKENISATLAWTRDQFVKYGGKVTDKDGSQPEIHGVPLNLVDETLAVRAEGYAGIHQLEAIRPNFISRLQKASPERAEQLKAAWASQFIEAIKPTSNLFNSNARARNYPGINEKFNDLFNYANNNPEAERGPGSFLYLIYKDPAQAATISKRFAEKVKGSEFSTADRLNYIEAFTTLKEISPDDFIIKDIEREILTHLTDGQDTGQMEQLRNRTKRSFEPFEWYYAQAPSNLKGVEQADLLSHYIDDNGVKHSDNFHDFFAYVTNHGIPANIFKPEEIQTQLRRVWYPTTQEIKSDNFTKQNFTRDLFRTYSERQDALGQAILYMNATEKELAADLNTRFPKMNYPMKVEVLKVINDNSLISLFDHNNDFGSTATIGAASQATNAGQRVAATLEYGNLKSAQANFEKAATSALKGLSKELGSTRDPLMKERYTNLLTQLCFSLVRFDKKSGYKECADTKLQTKDKTLTYKDYINMYETEQVCALSDFKAT